MGYSDSKLFVYEPERWQPALDYDYLIPEPATSQEYSNAIIEPLRFVEGSKRYFGTGLFSGGVCTSDFEHIAGQCRSGDGQPANKSCLESYEVAEDEIETVHERVIYGGVLTHHFGHMLVDGLSRMWYPVSHPEDDAKIACVVMYEETFDLWPILEAIGIPQERILIIDKPTRFDSVLVPDETMFSLGRHGVKKEWRLVAEAIRANADPSPYKKVYFTRTKLGFSGCIGEEYFEDFFRAKGFEIIAPETLSFKEQVSIVAGAEEFACTMGSVMLHMLYATPGSKLTVLNRSTSVARTEVLAAFVGDIETMYVDVFRNVLPDSQAGGSVWLLADNQHWRDYLAYRGWQNDLEAQVEYPLADNLLEYVKTWGWRYRGVQPFNWIKNEMLPDVVWRVNKYLRDEEVDVSQHHKPNKLLKLEDRVASQKAQMRTAWDLGGSYYDARDYLGDEMPEDAEALAYGSAPTYQIRRFTWAADNTLVLRFKIEHPWIQSGKMRPYIVLRKRLANKYVNKLREWRGTQEELVLTPAIMSFKETGESYFSLQISVQQVYDLLKPAEGDVLNFYIRYICDEPARNSEERFGNVREKGTFAQYARRVGKVGGVALYPYENAEKYLGFKILAPSEARALQQKRQNPQA